MKKILLYTFVIFIFFGNAVAHSKDRGVELNLLFEELKKRNSDSVAFEIEIKIWDIWSTHPTLDNLTQSLAKGSELMSKGELETAYKIFSTIIESDSAWAEGWNKRATVFYLMGRYQDSLKDINEVLKLENRHFGALSGQGLVHTALNNYEKAIKSYQAVQKIYPSIRAAKVMIPQLRKLIKEEAI